MTANGTKEIMNKKIVGAIMPEAIKAVEAGKCPLCYVVINPNEFKDDLSRKEFKISGMCQTCQDEVFGK